MINSRYKNAVKFLGKERVLLFSYLIITFLASIQQYLLPAQQVHGSQLPYFHYNNYIIFKNSFFHLLTNENLYSFHLSQQWDLFKYSPTFALFMGSLAYLPDWLGLLLWNLLNTLVLFFAIKKLPCLEQNIKIKIRWFILIELLTSIQNSQSNGLILGLFLWSFIFLERGKIAHATLFMLISSFIKIFGLVGFLIFILYPKKLATIIYSLFWTLLIAVLPLVIIPYEQLLNQYLNWLVLLKEDHSSSIGLSVMGWLTTWFSINPPKLAVVFSGLVLLLIPLMRIDQYSNYKYRLLLLASILIWVVIFNHKAESPTFIIAIGGVALWYYSQVPTTINQLLIVLVFIFSSLSPTDVFPDLIRQTIVLPYVLKAVPCIFVWLKLTIDLLTKNWKIEYSQAPYCVFGKE